MKKSNILPPKKGTLYLLLKRGETIFLEFSHAIGTCYLTSHLLITVEHEKSKLEEGTEKTTP